ncbi:FliO/MopB family protein [Thermogutta sp.]|uniref:FliO/MopB family protein n=1 Tax=Thermogutta sp. TaxID=1962930 RepID=UPI003C7E6FCF
MARKPRDNDDNIHLLVVTPWHKPGAVLSFLLFYRAHHPAGRLIPGPCREIRTGAISLLLLCLYLALPPGVGQAQAIQGVPDQWSADPGGFSGGVDTPLRQSQLSPGLVQPSPPDSTTTNRWSIGSGVQTKTLSLDENSPVGDVAGQRSGTVREPSNGKEAVGGEKALRISRRDSTTRGPTSTGSSFQRFTPWLTTVGALAMVVGVFLVFAWMLRRVHPQGHQVLPREVVEVLGHTALSARQRLCLIRLGRKVVLVAMSTETIEPITEIDDPVEVDRLVGLCVSQRPHSSTQTFRQLFNNYVNGHEIVGT